jgi:hypothetical protein
VARVVVLAAAAGGRAILRRGFVPPIPVVRDHTGLMAWDADWYRRIASGGYGHLPRPGLRFFPLYPLLARALAPVVGGHVDWALLAISNAAALALGALVHHFVLAEGRDAALARRAAWLVALAPPAFVLVMGYGEPLALCLSVSCVLALRHRRWWWAAAAGVLVGLARPVGVLLAVPALWEGLSGLRAAGGRERLARAAAVVAAPAGAAAFLVWVGARFGDPMLPLSVQRGAGLRGRTVSPATVVVRSVEGLARGDLGHELHHLWVLPSIVLAVIAFRRWPASLGAYAAATVVVALASEHLGSLERYVYGAFPVVLAGAAVTRSDRLEKAVLVAAGTAMGAYALAAFVGAYVP